MDRSTRPYRAVARLLVGTLGLTLGGCSAQPLTSPLEIVPVPTVAVAPTANPGAIDTAGMIAVPAGSFVQGSSDANSNLDERPPHSVFVAAFLIDEYEVTAGQYRRCVEARACTAEALDVQRMIRIEAEPEPACNYPHPDRSEHPMNCVSWMQAATYCAWLGKRLPSESEWEKAARGADGSAAYPWGEDRPQAGSANVANLADESARRRYPGMEIFVGYDDGYAETAPVGSFPDGRSVYGVQDTIGNVLEWTGDSYDATRYLKTDAEVAAGGGDSRFKVARGAAWDSFPKTVRITRRWGFRPDDRARSLGFRCAADASRADGSTDRRTGE